MDEDAKAARKALITRIRNSTKPTFWEKRPVFFLCPVCRNLVVQQTQKGERLEVSCCGQRLQPLVEHTGGAQAGEGADATDAGLALEHRLSVVVSGGFSSNAATITVGDEGAFHPMTQEHYIEWIYLYTFHGGQLRFLRPGGKVSQQARVVMALAEEDSYVYCDREVCKVCKFNCKRGFTAYAYCNVHGLWRFQL